MPGSKANTCPPRGEGARRRGRVRGQPRDVPNVARRAGACGEGVRGMGWVSATAAPLTPLGLGTKTGPGAPRWHQNGSYVPAQPQGLDAWLTATGIFPCPRCCSPPFRRVTVSEKATGCQDISIRWHRAPPPASPCVPRMERDRWLVPLSPRTRRLSEKPGWANVSLCLLGRLLLP